MTQKYKRTFSKFKLAMHLFRVKRQKKNIIRRKKVSLFRLRTRGFGFVWTSSFFRFFKSLLARKMPNFYFFKCNQAVPDCYLKNIAKVSTTSSLAFFKFFSFYSFFNTELNLQVLVASLKILNKELFFFKLFFFKLFFFKLFFFKLFLQRRLFID